MVEANEPAWTALGLFGANQEAVEKTILGRRSYERGDTIVHAGAAPSELHLLVAGWAARWVPLEDGSRAITDFHLQGDFRLAFALTQSHRTRTIAHGGGTVSKCENGNIIIVECLLDQLGYALCEFIQIEHVCDLCAHFTDKIQLIESESFHRHPMRSNETHYDHTGKPFEQVEFILPEFRTLRASDL